MLIKVTGAGSTFKEIWNYIFTPTLFAKRCTILFHRSFKTSLTFIEILSFSILNNNYILFIALQDFNLIKSPRMMAILIRELFIEKLNIKLFWKINIKKNNYVKLPLSNDPRSNKFSKVLTQVETRQLRSTETFLYTIVCLYYQHIRPLYWL